MGRMSNLAAALVLAGAMALIQCSGQERSTPAAVSASKRLLVLTHNAFYKHDSLGPAEQAVVELGRESGFDVEALGGYKQDPDQIDLSFISASYLAQFDAVMMMTNGELPMTDDQRQALVDFVHGGKGLVAVHQTVVTFYTFPAFGEMVGAYFARGPIFDTTNASKRMAVLKVEDRNHPATRMLGETWSLHDEFYQFAQNAWDPAMPEDNRGPTGHPVPMAFSRERVTVLLTLDTERTDFTGLTGWERGGDYPQAWYQQVGAGRSFYTSLGHRPDLWSSDPMFRAHILGALRWALRLEA